jgi:serine/threonine-protein kinase HipA
MLATYGGARLGLSKADMDDARERLTGAVHKVAPQVEAYAKSHPAFREVAKGMLDTWAAGLEDILPRAKPGKTAPAPLREQMGMSGPDAAALRKDTNPYVNADGPFSYKSR